MSVAPRGVVARAAALVLLTALTAALALAAAAAPAPPPGAPESVPVLRLDGQAYVGANDLARLLDATKFWRPDVRKLVLRTGAHRVTLTVDNPFVVLDERTLRLPAPVRSVGGELQAPVALLDSLPRDTTIARLLYDPGRGVVMCMPLSGVVRSPLLAAGDTLTRVVFPVDHVADVGVAGRARGHFRLRFGGALVGAAPAALPPGGLVTAIAPIPAATGCAFELQVSPAAQGFRLVRDPGPSGAGAPRSITLEISRFRLPGFEDFAPEEPPGPRALKVIVLDPGHGGDDRGVTVEGVAEKDLTLALARALKPELERRLHAQVLLTRDDDRALAQDQRAETANHARADLVLALHFDGAPGTGRAGASAWCPPALVGARREATGRNAPVQLLPWREVALRHAVRSRAVAEAVLGSLELAGNGPTRLHEVLPYPLLGVNAPGVLLECATLTAPADRARLAGPRGLQDLASAIADGLATWERGR